VWASRVALTVGSLFAGIGGFDLGLERAGMEIKWQVEIDPFCRAVLAKHWPHVRRYEDVRLVHCHGECGCGACEFCLGTVDVLCGGFPCQDVSVAGAGAGLSGQRSGLWFEMGRLLRLLRPRYLIVENTGGLFARGLGRVLADLADSRYDAEWARLSARDIGAPHERERVFLVAYPNEGDGRARVGHFENWPPPIFAGSHPQRDDVWLQTPRQALGMDDGVRGRAYRDRVGSLGNAIVPQIAEWIGRRIIDAEAERVA